MKGDFPMGALLSMARVPLNVFSLAGATFLLVQVVLDA